MASEQFKLAILASGNGSTSEAMLRTPGLVSLVISNNREAGILERANAVGVPSLAITRRDCRRYTLDGQVDQVTSDRIFQDTLLSALQWEEITHVAQQGWMVKTGSNVIDYFKGRITNSHPGPLDPGFLHLGGPGMYGDRVHLAAIILRQELGGIFVSGPSIQLVDYEYDEGDLLAYTKVGVLPTDTVESLAARIKSVEATQSLNFWKKVQQTGRMTPITRSKRLFDSSQYDIVRAAKAAAIARYSH